MAAFFVGGYTSALNLSRDRVLNHDVDKAKALLEENFPAYQKEAQDNIKEALDKLYGGAEVSLQQLSATFRRGDLLNFLDGF
ncbi:hypothetical protein [Marinagarivorans algicola]|uniref:hypothetical protein n=1 Tax=Marinagarivorans algicola TaxID=1513270 RepID=UPI0006B99425|nr:hypothetical protein [Marinagarivorans algicola]